MVSDYVYLGSYISSSEKKFLTEKGMAWSACNALHKIWTSNLTRTFKLQIFKAAFYMVQKPGRCPKILKNGWMEHSHVF